MSTATMTTRRGPTLGGGLYPLGGPLRHRRQGPVSQAGRTTVDAVCGAQVARVVSYEWDNTHPRACRKCRR